MINVRKNFWNWKLRRDDVLGNWFDHYPEYLSAAKVKQNPQRTVFTVDDRYYVKLFTPHKLDDKLRELLFPRAEREFTTGLELEKAGIPVIEYLGWGRRFTTGMLVSTAEPDARTLWQCRPGITQELLAKLADLTRMLVERNYFHPDYHAGNLLVCGQGLKLVDVYGIVKIDQYGDEQNYRMCRMILGLKEFLNNTQAVEFMIRSGLAENPVQAMESWNEYLVRDGIHLKKDWEKRSRQIRNYYGKFVLAKENTVYRKMPDESAADLDGAEIKEYPPEEAMALWLDSFRLELAGLPCRKPLALKDGSILYWEQNACPEWNEETQDRAWRMELS
jgi:hypothetical protein